MNRRLVIRCGIACLALCLAAWKLPPMLDRMFTSIDQHKGTISLLTAEGVAMPLTTTGTPVSRAETTGVEVFAASGAALTAEQRARLLEAAQRNDPLAQLKARERAADTPKAPTTTPKPGEAPARSPEDVLRELGIDPSNVDPASVDVEALLKKAREGDPASKPKP